MSINGKAEEESALAAQSNHVCENFYPSIEYLRSCRIKTNVSCPKCNLKFQQTSALSFHLEKCHYLEGAKVTMFIFQYCVHFFLSFKVERFFKFSFID